MRTRSLWTTNSPGSPLALWVPTWVKNKPRVLFQLRLLCKKARFVFSPALKIYFAESKARTIVGSVSDETVLRTEADQFIELECWITLKGLQWKWRRVRKVGKKNPASLTSLLRRLLLKLIHGYSELNSVYNYLCNFLLYCATSLTLWAEWIFALPAQSLKPNVKIKIPQYNFFRRWERLGVDGTGTSERYSPSRLCATRDFRKTPTWDLGRISCTNEM